MPYMLTFWIYLTTSYINKFFISGQNRLTFWLSNTIVLRAIVTETSKYPDIPKSASIRSTNNGSVKLPKNKSSPLKWESISYKNEKFSFSEEFGDWDDPDTLISALERIENWIFSRTVESVWWQVHTYWL